MQSVMRTTRHLVVTFAAAATLLTGLYACSSDSTSSSSTSSSGGKADGGSSSSSSSGGSSSSSSSGGSSSSSSSGPSSGDGGTGVNGCTTFVDRTDAAASRALTFDFGIASVPERCMKVKVGQDVVFNGVADFHPLSGFGGDPPSPFPTGATTDPTTVSFSAAGTFGYHCDNHASMNGAIQVVP